MGFLGLEPVAAIAIITARGESKRISRKNVREFSGRPMIAWPIETALNCGLFEQVLVSTDDPEIAAVATQAGAQVPFMRPAELADDHSGTLEVVRHAVHWATDQGWTFNSACCLYGTAVFTLPKDLDAARQLGADWDYIFAAGRFARPVQRAFTKNDVGAMSLMFPDYALTRSQDLEPTYYDAGQFYWGSKSAWEEGRPIFGKSTTFIELPPERAIDIDTPDDWAMAERQFREWKQGRGE